MIDEKRIMEINDFSVETKFKLMLSLASDGNEDMYDTLFRFYLLGVWAAVWAAEETAEEDKYEYFADELLKLLKECK